VAAVGGDAGHTVTPAVEGGERVLAERPGLFTGPQRRVGSRVTVARAARDSAKVRSRCTRTPVECEYTRIHETINYPWLW
jgi:hypothetical protein